MTGAVAEVLDLVVRWVHLLAGIMWIGNSLLFNWLDRSLRPRPQPDVYGDIWLIHSGGFYHVEKNTGERTAAGHTLPAPLHWFKWQAYTTWLSGAALLVVVYYAGGRALLVDPQRSALSARAGVAVAIGVLVAGWVLYETLWRFVGRQAPGAARGLSVLLLIGAAELLLSLLSGRAAFLHVGALLGTIMAGNVAFTIMPSQRELVAALRAGREPSQAIADRAKTRSIHNNYLTFPVVALMLAAHFPALYARRGDLALLTILASGAAVRHLLNIRFTYRAWRPALAATIAAAALALALEAGAVRFGAARDAGPAGAVPARASFEDIRRIVDRRCAACHSATPSDVSLGVMPAGIAFDTPAQIRALAPRIHERAVVQRTMPPGNKTRMTDTERAILGAWTERQ